LDRTSGGQAPVPGYLGLRSKFANYRRSHQTVPLFGFLAKPELPQPPPIRGEYQRDRVAQRRYAADQMQVCHQDLNAVSIGG
jgi:hypothetical protein